MLIDTYKTIQSLDLIVIKICISQSKINFIRITRTLRRDCLYVVEENNNIERALISKFPDKAAKGFSTKENQIQQKHIKKLLSKTIP